MPSPSFAPARPASQRGLSLVELMVGIAVGLFIVAGASMVVSTQLGDNRRLLLETQLHQDLRATADIITRELRRAGAEGSATSHVWAPADAASSAPSAQADIDQDDGPSAIEFRYVRLANPGPWGFKLEPRSVGGVDRGVIRTRLSTGGWQDLTDVNTLDVTGFRVARNDDLSTRETLPCPRACSADPLDTSCWPTLDVRTYEVEIAARAVSDARVQRSIRSTVRLRNDQLAFGAGMPADQACP